MRMLKIILERNRIKKGIIIILAAFVLCSCDESNIDEDKIQRDIGDEIIDASESSEILIEENQDRAALKESLKYLFDYLYPNKENMTEITLYNENKALYYKYKFIVSTGEISDPYVLYYMSTTDDGFYHKFELYGEIWETVYSKEGKWRKHARNSHSNYYYLNTQSKEIIPQWIYNQDAEDDASYCIDNEEYLNIERKY